MLSKSLLSQFDELQVVLVIGKSTEQNLEVSRHKKDMQLAHLTKKEYKSKFTKNCHSYLHDCCISNARLGETVQMQQK